MGRPLSVTDDEILEATERVVATHGANALTISEVARQVGLSRAAITLRFAGAEALKERLLERKSREFEERMGSVVVERGASGLRAIADMLGNMLGEREEFSQFWTRYTSNIDDPQFRSMEARRGLALRALIAQAMPETAIDQPAAVDAFMAQMTGSMINWQASEGPAAGEFLRKRAIDWIRLAGIPFDQERP